MSGLPYQGGMNSYMFDISQYGVNMPQYDNTGEMLQQTSGLASMIPYIGPILAAGMNFAGQHLQNQQQEYFYNQYMSPAARMAQMKAAGINPNAAAQGIAGAAAPNMVAAAPTGAFNSIGEQLGQSANTVLTAGNIKADTALKNSETALNDSLNVEKTITNSYLNKQQEAVLNKLVYDGEIAKSTANMLRVDEAYKPATAYASYQQLASNLTKISKEIDNLVAATIHEYASAYQSMMAGDLSEAQIHKVFSDIGLNNATIEKISHEVNNLDASTALSYQAVDESKARQAAQQIQNKFQGDYYDIWQTTGFNWNSDIDKSIVGAYSNLQIDEGNRMLIGLGKYIKGTNDAEVASDKYVADLASDVAKSCVHAIGLYGGATQVVKSTSPAFRRKVFH